MEPKDFSRALLASMKSENVMQEMMSVAIRAISTEIAPIFEKMESLRRDINCLVTTEIADFKTKISDLTEGLDLCPESSRWTCRCPQHIQPRKKKDLEEDASFHRPAPVMSEDED
ncbi:hypothetical protein CAPTEDRAFT_188851 [Capitella teleta]|uniref:Uncharacterized protein n=1 Tax=Capitella teleta TaxID=283909 RepID=R7T677_CAPTE|nr:hypothetical protein CAPTEDRAFT_188851 [Capitella teleta]|eukprot:ELT88920.1 hypothetical protein CAPTEDRAFT_188851 [Capitella teleta]